MLWFVGLGISGPNSISEETKKVLREADYVYLEQFTSPQRASHLKRFRQMVKGKFILAKRWMVEDGTEILKYAKRKKVVLLSYGDPYIATTHIELRTRAINEKIKTYTSHSSSAITSMIGECGLHYYKVGRLATIINDPKTITTPYYVIYKNLVEGNHTILLLEYDQEKDFFLSPNRALELLQGEEREQTRKVIGDSLYVIVASRIGLKNQKIVAGKISSLKEMDFGKPPHSIIVPGSMHFTEVDAVKVLADCIDSPQDNTKSIEKISHQMIKKYVPMVREAIRKIAPLYVGSKNFEEILENAELYAKDAEMFLEQGKDEVAILSIGYADGLVDALRIAKGIKPDYR